MSPTVLGGIALGVVIAFLLLRSGDDRVSLPAAAAPAEAGAQIQQLAAAGRKIEAIKLYREAHGVGLKEAKEAVEALPPWQPPTGDALAISGPDTKRGQTKRCRESLVEGAE